jgi:hypothetical protein
LSIYPRLSLDAQFATYGAEIRDGRFFSSEKKCAQRERIPHEIAP